MHTEKNSPAFQPNIMPPSEIDVSSWVPASDLKNDKAEEIKRLNKEAVDRAIAEDPDKEPFDYQKFAGLYWKKEIDTDLTGEEDKMVRESFEQDYYLRFRDVKNVEEFAKMLEESDAVAGN